MTEPQKPQQERELPVIAIFADGVVELNASSESQLDEAACKLLKAMAQGVWAARAQALSRPGSEPRL